MIDEADIESRLRELAQRPCFATPEEIAASMRTSLAEQHGVPEEWVEVVVDGSNITTRVWKDDPAAVKIDIVTVPL